MRLIDPEQVLETQRLRLEPLQPDHATELFSLLRDAQIYRYIPQEPPAALSLLTQRYKQLARRLSPAGDQAWLNWAIALTSNSAYIGQVEATVLEDQTAYLAYLIGSTFWGHGYATEACSRIIRLLFDDYGVTCVKAEVDTRNTASMRLLERLGFTRIGYQANADFFKGSSSDEYTYCLSAAEHTKGFYDRA
ncbi:MAG TPA: GNAT family protein [Herpetosiphonaceae bacterium]